MTTLMLSLTVSFVLTLVALMWLLHGGLGHMAMDQPNQRSLHAHPIPRTGGLALMFGVMLSWLAVQAPMNWMMLPLLVGLLAVSFLDDLRDLSAAWRFLAHFVVAGIFALFGVTHGLNYVGIGVLVLTIVWVTNLYNFMDGSDGLAGGMTLFGFGCYAIAAWLAGDVGLTVTTLPIAAAAMAFLLFNFHPAKIFMGDAGSIPLGFLAAALGLLGWQRGDWPLWLPLLVFSPFIVDATVTLLKRLLRGEKVWQAHRSHYYQRLVQMGWGHRNTALAEYGLMAAAGSSALWLMHQSWRVQVAGLLCWGLVYWRIALLIDRKWLTNAKLGQY